MASKLPFTNPFIIGVVHLKPLPGSPRFKGDLEGIRKAALDDVQALVKGGVHGLLVENYGDAPFFPGRVEPHTVAVMTALVQEISSRATLPLGVNVLRNDGHSALGIACAGHLAFVRINVFTGACVTDQGLIEGEAHSLLRYRKTLQLETAVLADVHVKHGHPLGDGSISDAAKDAFHRGGADAVIVTGSATGSGVDTDELSAVRQALPSAPIIVGSGVTDENVNDLLTQADGAIVGTWLKQGGKTDSPVDPTRVSRLMNRLTD